MGFYVFYKCTLIAIVFFVFFNWTTRLHDWLSRFWIHNADDLRRQKLNFCEYRYRLSTTI